MIACYTARAMKLTLATITVASVSIAFAAPARADDRDPSKQQAVWTSPGEEPPVEHAVSLTFSPLLLLASAFQFTAEFRADPHVGLALVGGYASVTDATTTTAASVGVTEIGARASFYAFGNFDQGLHVGLQGIYASASGSSSVSTTLVSSGLSFGSFVGYKVAADVGVTFDVGLGVQYVFISSPSVYSASDSTTQTKIEPLGVVDVGWSF